jgi:hypothetical protein
MDGAWIERTQADQVVPEDMPSSVEHQDDKRFFAGIEPVCGGDIGFPVFHRALWIIHERSGRLTLPDPHDFEFTGLFPFSFVVHGNEMGRTRV